MLAIAKLRTGWSAGALQRAAPVADEVEVDGGRLTRWTGGGGQVTHEGAVFVEISRLMVVLLCTALGYHLLGGSTASATGGPLLGACLGAGIGYVQGGVIGRGLHALLLQFQRTIAAADAAVLLAGAVGALVLGGVGIIVGTGAVALLPGRWGWPILGLLAWVGLYAGFSAGAAKGEELIALLRRPLAPAGTISLADSRSGEPLVLIDSSAAIDGRLVATAASGFLPGRLAVPRFVLDELQGIADAADPGRRRRGRRALEALAAVQAAPEQGLVVLEDEVPERAEVDAKLVVLAQRLAAPLLTTDTNLRRVAELQGVRCLDLGDLARSLRPVLVPGETVRITVSRQGRDAGQGVGYLEDGTMVVVNDGGDRLGADVDVTIASSIETSKGRMFFASLTG